VIEYEPAQIAPAAIIEQIEALGFTGKEIEESVALAKPDKPDAPVKVSKVVKGLLEQARRENKALVLEISGEFCAACVRLEKETLHDPRVQEALKKFIFHKIMVEEHRDAVRQFNIHSIPQLRFLTPDGTVVAKDKGVISVETMLGHLNALEENQ